MASAPWPTPSVASSWSAWTKTARRAGRRSVSRDQTGWSEYLPPRERALVAFCSNRLAPPFDPEVAAVPLDNGQVVLVVRVDDGIALRPMTVRNQVLVRTEEGNRPADIFRLRALFNEAGNAGGAAVLLPNPNSSNQEAFHSDPPADLAVRTVGSARLAGGALPPLLGERIRIGILAALMGSTFELWWRSTGSQNPGLSPFWDLRGQITSSRVEFRRVDTVEGRITRQATFRIEVPPRGRGAFGPGHIQFNLDVVFHLANSLPGGPHAWRLPVEELVSLFEAVLGTFAETVPLTLAEVLPADMGPMAGPVVGVLSREAPINEVVRIDSIGAVHEHGAGRVAELYPDPRLNLRYLDDRKEQAIEMAPSLAS